MRRIDTDVHVAPRDLSELTEYLPRYWSQYIDEGSVRLRPEQRAVQPTPDGPAPQPDVPATLGELSSYWDVGSVTAAILSCTVLFDLTRNPDFEIACARAVNNWLSDRFVAEDTRLYGSIVLPSLDLDAARVELDRVAQDERFVQVILPVRGETRWGDRRFRPLFAAAAEAGLVVCLHSGGRTGLNASGVGYSGSFIEQLLADQHLAAQNQLVSLVANGTFVHTPNLQLTLAECGFTWLHPLLWRLDKDWKSLWREVPWLDRPPSEIIGQRVRFTLEPSHLPPSDQEVIEIAELCDVPRNVMYCSDFPHAYRSGAARLLALLEEQPRQQVLYENAREHYPRLAACQHEGGRPWTSA